MSGYVKLFSSILTSSVWGEADSTRIVWITLLALADRNGEAMASVGGLARSANMEREACERAIEVLSSPDPDDRSGVRDGVRIEKIQGGWRIINFAAYREKMRAADRTEYLRRKQAESRARRRARAVNKASTSQPCQPLSTGINQDQPIAASSTATTTTTKKNTAQASPAPVVLTDALAWNILATRAPAVAVDSIRPATEKWFAHRRKKRFAMSVDWWRDQVDHLGSMDPQDAIASLEFTCRSLYQGLVDKKATVAKASRDCDRCSGKGYAEIPIPGGAVFDPELGRSRSTFSREPCKRCQGSGKF